MMPDELCPHVQIGAAMAGGVLFAAEQPEIAVGMCAECLNLCQSSFETLAPMEESEHVLRMSDEEIAASIVAEGNDPKAIAERTRQLMIDVAAESRHRREKR